jgi:hypothetical protein
MELAAFSPETNIPSRSEEAMLKELAALAVICVAVFLAPLMAAAA